MRKNNLWKKTTAIALSICMLSGTGISSLGNMSYVWAASSYNNTFEDVESISNWEKPMGGGTYSITDGKLDVATDNWVSGSVDYQLVYDTSAPVVRNGSVSADIDNLTGFGRFGLVFRYVDLDNYDMVGYDLGGNWTIKKVRKGTVTETTFSGPNVDNQSFHFQVDFSGSSLTVYKDGTQLYTGEVLDDTIEGKVGVRTWGYTANYAHITLDNLMYGSTVSLSPSKKTISWEEAGTADVVVELSDTENAFTGISVDDTDLEAETDYVVNDAKDTITIKKEYIAKLKDSESLNTTFVFTFADGFTTSFQLKIQAEPNAETPEHIHNFATDADKFEIGTGSANVSVADGKMSVSDTNQVILLDSDQETQNLQDCEVEYQFDPKNDNGNFGIVVRYASASDWTMISQEGYAGQTSDPSGWYMRTSSGANVKLVGDGQRVYANRVKPYTVKVRVVGDVVTVFLDNAEIYNGKVDGMTTSAGSVGLKYWGGFWC